MSKATCGGAQVEPGHTADYAWDEPQAVRKLRCELDGAHVSLHDPVSHVYALDEIKVIHHITSLARLPLCRAAKDGSQWPEGSKICCDR